jgi:hypothetical protein
MNVARNAAREHYQCWGPKGKLSATGPGEPPLTNLEAYVAYRAWAYEQGIYPLLSREECTEQTESAWGP